MARVIDYWPDKRALPKQQMEYPWKDWANGNIWLADQGVDFPNTCHTLSFRSILYGYAQRHSRIRQRRLNEKVEALRAEGKTVRRVPKAKKLKVVARIVSDSQVAFQFFNEGDEPDQETPETATPKQRRPATALPPKRPTAAATPYRVSKRKALR